MTLCVLGLFAAEARNSSIISPKSGDLLRYLIFHFAQSVPAGALLVSSTTSRSLFSESVRMFKGCIGAAGSDQIRYSMFFSVWVQMEFNAVRFLLFKRGALPVRGMV